MSKPHEAPPSPAPRTYTAQAPVHGVKLTCRRCGRQYAFPQPGDPAIRCECGWSYRNEGGAISEEFKPRIGVDN